MRDLYYLSFNLKIDSKSAKFNYAASRRTNPIFSPRKSSTKGKLATRTIPIIEDLRLLLVNYFPSPRTYNLFSGRGAKGHINPDYAAQILRKACYKLGLEGVSTHSFRRTALTQMSSAGIPLRVIQEI